LLLLLLLLLLPLPLPLPLPHTATRDVQTQRHLFCLLRFGARFYNIKVKSGAVFYLLKVHAISETRVSSKFFIP
jgi:hypothetical protein